MILSYIWTSLVAISIFFALLGGRGAALSTSVLTGAEAGIEISLAIAGSICLWSGVENALSAGGILPRLGNLFRPLLGRIYPHAFQEQDIAEVITANFCANLFGLGNAATPMGIKAVSRISRRLPKNTASKELSRFIVMNTASIQLVPTNIASIRARYGSSAPFDIIPAVWFTSLCSVSAGLFAAWLLERSTHD